MANYQIFDTVIDYQKSNAHTLNIDLNEEVGHNDFIMINGTCRVQKEISTLLAFWKGEECLNRDLGFDYPTFFKLWNTNRKGVARSMLLSALHAIDDVIRVNSLNINEDLDNHILRITYDIETTYGRIRKSK